MPFSPSSNGGIETHRSTWKKQEMAVARMFGSTRTPLSGRNSRHGTSSDSLHPELYIELKTKSKIPFWTTWLETVDAAGQEGKAPLLVIHKKGSHRRVAMVDVVWLAELWKKAKEKESRKEV